MKKKLDWKYIISCVSGGFLVVVSCFLYESAPTSAICFTTVGVMIPMGYSLFWEK